jgi:hypothetical protein
MSNNTSGFGQFVPGFEFLQKLVNPAASSAGQGMPNLASWVAPTLNVEDLEKRIEELKAVHFWLEQNSKALSATIQAMEVQRMTLATLRDLNVNFGEMAKAGEAAAQTASKGFAGFEMPAAARTEPEPEAGEAEAEPEDDSELEPEPAKDPAPDSAGAPQDNKVDPMQWWGALQQQFQNIAVSAMDDLAKQSAPGAAKQPASAKAPAKKAPAKKAPARKKAPASKKTVASKKAPTRTRSR